MAIEVTSVFANGSPIPPAYTGDGEDISPPLQWTGVPAGTRSLAVIADDPDARRGPWVHWVLFNLPPETSGLPEGVPTTAELPQGARQGVNDSHTTGYSGPYPPPGPPHRYFFNVYALDTLLSLTGPVTKAQLEKAMHGHILDQGAVMGTFKR